MKKINCLSVIMFALFITGCEKNALPLLPQKWDRQFEILQGDPAAVADKRPVIPKSVYPNGSSIVYFQAHDELNDDGYPRDFLVTALQVKVYYYNSSVSADDAIDSATANRNNPAKAYLVKPFYRTTAGADASSFNADRTFGIPLYFNRRIVIECFFVNGFDAYGDERYTRKRITFIHKPWTAFKIYRIETDEYLANIEDNHYLAFIRFFRQRCRSGLFEAIPPADSNFKWNYNGESRSGGQISKYVLSDLSQITILPGWDYQYMQFQRNHFSDTRYRDTAQIAPTHCW